MKSTAVSYNSSLRRSPWGEKQRAREQHEAKQVVVLEGSADRLGLFDLHRIDWLHISTPQRDKGPMKSGHPDYLLGGKHIETGVTFMAFLEIKHGKLPGVKGIGKMSASQHWFHAWLKDRGQEVWTAWLPEDLVAVNLWLREKTGVVCGVDGLL